MSANIHDTTQLPMQAGSDIWCGDTSKCSAALLNFDIPDALLAEVDFKWLMAGQGLRVDPKRFYADPVYTMDLLQTALSSDSYAVRECAAYLLVKIESASTVRRPHAGDLQLAILDAELAPVARPIPSLLNRRTTRRAAKEFTATASENDHH